MKFRIKHHPGIGYWPQVKHFWSGWKKIGSHVVGYGLYEADDLNSPKDSEGACEQVIDGYKKWLILKKNKPHYSKRVVRKHDEKRVGL